MDSATAHGWLIAALINDHLGGWDPDFPERNAYCPDCCGPCGALRDYFGTTWGRAEADAYVLACKGLQAYLWQLPDRRINWDYIEYEMNRGFCVNHSGRCCCPMPHFEERHEDMGWSEDCEVHARPAPGPVSASDVAAVMAVADIPPVPELYVEMEDE